MKKFFTILLCLLSLTLSLHSVNKNKKYDPWYTGSLLAGGAVNQAPGTWSTQPYLYVLKDYAVYNSSWKKETVPYAITVNPTCDYQVGITNWLDVTLTVQAIYSQNNTYRATEWGDTTVEFGFQAKYETDTWPNIRLTLTESFPTGRYNDLSRTRSSVQATGSGSYETYFTLDMSKVVYWIPWHPINLKLTSIYTIPTKVNVKGFSSYGGGHDTDGKVTPGNNFTTIVAFEFSFNQQIVYAMDISYLITSKTKFSGNNGTIEGEDAINTAPESQQLSLTPSMEYNFTANAGIIAGAWFSVMGKNSIAFTGGVVSLWMSF
jgi:hypothetical protein